MKLGAPVPEWHEAWKWFSVQGLAALAIIPIIYENAGFIQDYISATVYHYGMGALGALTLISRLVKQGDS